MRYPWPAIALLLAACAGGQTGEITELGACREPLEAVALDAPSAAGASADAQLARLTLAAEGELVWADGRPATTASVAFAPTGEPATLVGGEGCERPFLHVPVTVTVRTGDGALDESIDAAVALRDVEVASVRGALPLAALNGTLEVPEANADRATLEVALGAEPDALGGQLFLHAGDEAEDARPLASF